MKLSVIVPVYKAEAFLHRCVDSILNQTRKPDEVVLVVDGPIPLSLAEVVAAYEAMPFFRVIRLETNSGHGHARRT